MTHLVSMTVGGTVEPWSALGLRATENAVSLGGVELVCDGGPVGMHSWCLAVPEDSHPGSGETTIDGIRTLIEPGVHATYDDATIGNQRVVGVDHVVINTDDLDRTCAAIESAIGEVVRRERDAGNGVEQRFFRLDNTIVEVVSGPHTKGSSASLWGFVISVDDLFEAAESLGPDTVSPPKRATQPGRFISTVRSSVGLGVPLAMMTPHVRGMSTR